MAVGVEITVLDVRWLGGGGSEVLRELGPYSKLISRALICPIESMMKTFTVMGKTGSGNGT